MFSSSRTFLEQFGLSVKEESIFGQFPFVIDDSKTFAYELQGLISRHFEKWLADELEIQENKHALVEYLRENKDVRNFIRERKNTKFFRICHNALKDDSLEFFAWEDIFTMPMVLDLD